MAVSIVGIMHVIVVKIPCIVYGGGNLWRILIPAGFIVGGEAVQRPSAGHDFPCNGLCSGIGIVYGRYAKRLRRLCRETVNGQPLQQFLLFLS